ncbi:calmodulin-binding protein 60 D-like isoform X2 [Curcuma longa]
MALSKHLASFTTQCEKQVGSAIRSLRLEFKNKLSLPIFTGSRIEGENSSAISVALVDAFTGEVITIGPVSSLKVEMVVLHGDFEVGEDGNWTADEFKNYIVKERDGKRSLLTGDVFVDLKGGIGVVGELIFTDNSSWTRSRKFRLGARIADGHCNGIRIREAKTEPFMVKDHRGELYKKHYPPSLDDEVWRLEKIGKDGAFHKRLSLSNINTVKEFLMLFWRDSSRLRNILGSGMSARMWEVTVDHARTCFLGDEVHVYYPNGQRKTGFVFNVVGEALGTYSEQQFIPLTDLQNSAKIEALTLVKQASDHWNDVVTYEKDEILGTSLPEPSISFYGTENLFSSFPSPIKNDAFGFAHSGILSPDVFPMSIRDFDTFPHDSHSASLFDECSSQAFISEENFRYLPTHDLISGSPADLLVKVGHTKPRRIWKTLSVVFMFIRRIVITMKTGAQNLD